jgi:hypothetical protein
MKKFNMLFLVPISCSLFISFSLSAINLNPTPRQQAAQSKIFSMIEHDADRKEKEHDEAAKRCAEFLTDGRLCFVVDKIVSDSKDTLKECFKAGFDHCKLSREQIIMLKQDIDTLLLFIDTVSRVLERYKEIYDDEMKSAGNSVLKKSNIELMVRTRLVQEFPQLNRIAQQVMEMSQRWEDFGYRLGAYMADEILKRKIDFLVAGMCMLKSMVEITSSVVDAHIDEIYVK